MFSVEICDKNEISERLRFAYGKGLMVESSPMIREDPQGQGQG